MRNFVRCNPKKMKNTVHRQCRQLASLLSGYGVRRVVLSPGSRNTPLILAISRRADLQTVVVIDERCAAFAALGMAGATGRPVAMVCTSGTAPLNYGPALAEAFYRHIPLVAVTADRPRDRVDQLECQTIRQVGVFGNFVKASYDLWGLDDAAAARTVADALITAQAGTPGPVHINVPLNEPLGLTEDVTDGDADLPRHIKYIALAHVSVDLGDARPGNVLIVAGPMQPDAAVARAVERLAALPCVAVVAELTSNLPAGTVRALDPLFGRPELQPRPDLVVTIGGAVTSGLLRSYLKGLVGVPFWSIGQGTAPKDPFGRLTRIIDCPTAAGLDALYDRCAASPATDFAERYRALDRAAALALSDFNSGGDTALSLIGLLDRLLTDAAVPYRLHLSNGMTVRYAGLYPFAGALTCTCNRGCSGIDGSTATAIGAAMTCPDTPTLLLTGDMSAQYDLGALAMDGIPASFRMVVFANGGGNIFRHIATTRGLDERERCFAGPVRLPLQGLAAAFGLGYYRATSAAELRACMDAFMAPQGRPAILELVTDGDNDAARYIDFYKNITEYVKPYLDNN